MLLSKTKTSVHVHTCLYGHAQSTAESSGETEDNSLIGAS